MNGRFNFLRKLRFILTESSRPLQLLSIIGAAIAILGLVGHVYPIKALELIIMFDLMPNWTWIILFLGYGCVRFYGLFICNCKKWMTYAIPTFGIWLWSMVFVSAAANSLTDGLFHMMPIFAEVLILMNAIISWNTPITDRRKKSTIRMYQTDFEDTQ